jgi:hypothetical protein
LAEKQGRFLLAEQNTEQLLKTRRVRVEQETAAAQAALRDQKQKAQTAAEELMTRWE